MKTRICYETHTGCHGSTCNHEKRVIAKPTMPASASEAVTRPKTAHTPGPWASINTGYVHCRSSDGVAMLARVYAPRGTTASECESEVEANARLIAAAPTLLDACKAAFERLTDNDMIEAGSYPLCNLLEAAIKAAESEAAR